LSEVVDVAKKFAYRVDRSRVPAVSAWTKDIAADINRDPEGTRTSNRSHDQPVRPGPPACPPDEPDGSHMPM
jgi:hypothetical protein